MIEKEGFPEPVNLRDPQEMTVLGLANMIIRKINSEVAFEQLPEDDSIKRKPNIELVIKTLFWKPVVTIEDGLDKTTEYFKVRH